MIYKFFFCHGIAKEIKGFDLFLEESDLEYKNFKNLIDLQKIDEDLNNFFSHGKRILLLSDGFQKKWYKLAENLQLLVPKNIEIYKTDIECPEELDGTNKDNIFYKKIDNLKTFPFEDKFFDMILMRYGLCICQEMYKTCCGMESEDQLRNFFLEVCRLLNTHNKYGFAFLHGPSIGEECPKFQPFEEWRYKHLLKIFAFFQHQYPIFNIKNIFFKEGKAFKFQGVYIKTEYESVCP